jgi:hypothetical protein
LRQGETAPNVVYEVGDAYVLGDLRDENADPFSLLARMVHTNRPEE